MLSTHSLLSPSTSSSSLTSSPRSCLELIQLNTPFHASAGQKIFQNWLFHSMSIPGEMARPLKKRYNRRGLIHEFIPTPVQQSAPHRTHPHHARTHTCAVTVERGRPEISRRGCGQLLPDSLSIRRWQRWVGHSRRNQPLA